MLCVVLLVVHGFVLSCRLFSVCICDLCVVVLERLCVFCCLSYARDVRLAVCERLCDVCSV